MIKHYKPSGMTDATVSIPLLVDTSPYLEDSETPTFLSPMMQHSHSTGSISLVRITHC